ncbi:unnamed protein product [Phytophthora lilii]|uniref:Unnamed protein product n=1 Tax=Phytophthora lilii TaxID=2077276 RepID=A0A9W6X6K9_9STRA|nr:unnamed protein product [Phytophthora lilii]
MDQTSVYWEMGRRTTVEFVGATTVRTTTNTSEGYRCTMAVRAAADGRVLPPHYVYNGDPGGDVEAEVTKYFSGEVAAFSVQKSAWFDERVMMEWIDKCWKHIVCEPSVLILDSLSVHKKAEIADAKASAISCTGTAVLYVPGGCTGVAQPLDVGIMAPLKQHMRRLNTLSRGGPKKVTPQFRRRSIFETAMDGLRCVSSNTVKNAFVKAGPFVPFGPSNHADILTDVGNEPAASCSAEVILEEGVL